MKLVYTIFVTMIVTVTTIANAQEVRIESLSSNGKLTWQCPSNSDCTVEWANSLTGTWNRTWLDLMNIRCTNSIASASVPMFYRVSC